MNSKTGGIIKEIVDFKNDLRAAWIEFPDNYVPTMGLELTDIEGRVWKICGLVFESPVQNNIWGCAFKDKLRILKENSVLYL